MISTEEYDVRVIRAFGKWHRDQVISVLGWRALWLLKHGFVKAEQSQQTARPGRPRKGVTAER